MTDQQILQELEAILEALGIHVRHETLEGFSGGLCTVNGCCSMFLDACAQPADLARLCAGAVTSRADLDTMYLKPEVRRYLEEAVGSGRIIA
jgi:hypothetical protein